MTSVLFTYIPDAVKLSLGREGSSCVGRITPKILAVKNFQGLYIVSKNFLRKFRDFIYSLGFL